jgi:hypothetical protein
MGSPCTRGEALLIAWWRRIVAMPIDIPNAFIEHARSFHLEAQDARSWSHNMSVSREWRLVVDWGILIRV